MIRKLLQRTIRWASSNQQEKLIAVNPSTCDSLPRPNDFNVGHVVFRLYPAQGGTVIEIGHNDPGHGRYSSKLYVIDDSEDFGESMSKIITMERLTV